jgi:quinol monooxygenase YgiN
MSAKYRSLPLLALAPLVFATPAPARADQQQYVVIYLELLPALQEPGADLLDALAAFGRRRGANSFSVNQEIGRSNFYVLLETWKSASDYQAFLKLDKTQALMKQIGHFLEAPFDERDGTLIE